MRNKRTLPPLLSLIVFFFPLLLPARQGVQPMIRRIPTAASNQGETPIRSQRPALSLACDTLIHSDGSSSLIFYRRLTATDLIYCECGEEGGCEKQRSRGGLRAVRLSNGLVIEIEKGKVVPAQQEQAQPVVVYQYPEPKVEWVTIANSVITILLVAISYYAYVPVFLVWLFFWLVLSLWSLVRLTETPRRYKLVLVAKVLLVLAFAALIAGLGFLSFFF